MTTDAIAPPRSTAPLPRLRFGALIEAWIARDACRRQMRQLRMMDDRLLRDMGLTRDDVRR